MQRPWSNQSYCVCLQDEDSHESLKQLLKHGLGRVTVAAELLCLCGMAPFLYIEAGTFLEYGFYGWRSVWNFMDVVAYVNQVRDAKAVRCLDVVVYLACRLVAKSDLIYKTA